MTSLETSLRYTGWRRYTPKINLSKSGISSERLYHSRSRFSKKSDGKRRSFLEWKNWCLFHWSAENNSWPELLHCSVEDFLTAWMSSTLSRQWHWIPARQCSVTPRKSDATVSTTEHSRFHSNVRLKTGGRCTDLIIRNMVLVYCPAFWMTAVWTASSND